jgi:chromosome segregation ATPase
MQQAQQLNSPQFMYIVQNSTTLQRLVLQSRILLDLAQDGSDLKELPQIKQKLVETLTTAVSALRKSDEVAVKTSGYDNSLVDLYAKTAALEEKTKPIAQHQAQQKTISDEVKQQSQAIEALGVKANSTRSELVGSIDNLTARAGMVDTTISTLDRRTMSLGEKLDGLNRSVTSLDQALESLDVDQIQEFCAVSPQLVLAINQIQKVLSDVNANTNPNARSDYTFSFNIKEMEEKLGKKRTAAFGKKKS